MFNWLIFTSYKKGLFQQAECNHLSFSQFHLSAQSSSIS